MFSSKKTTHVLFIIVLLCAIICLWKWPDTWKLNTLYIVLEEIDSQTTGPKMASSSHKAYATQRNLAQLSGGGDGEKRFSCLLTDCSLRTCTSNIPVKAESGECSAAGFSKCVQACRWWGEDDRMQPEQRWLQAELSSNGYVRALRGAGH